jgi:hypothetical protein
MARHMLNPKLKGIFIFLCAMHISLAVVTILYCVTGTPRHVLYFEHDVNEWIGIRNTDYVRGYVSVWAIALPLATALSVAFLLSNLKRTLVGASLLVPVLVWYWNPCDGGNWFGPWDRMEALATLCCVATLAFCRPNRLLWSAIPLSMLHFVYWWFSGTTDPSSPGYGGPAGAILGSTSVFVGVVVLGRAETTRAKSEA